jgi:hypothetical protein
LIHAINISGFRRLDIQINTSEVNKTTGTYWVNQALDSILDQIYVLLSGLETNKMNITDQRYNDTLLIENVNQSLTNLSKVKAHQENLTITTAGGIGTNTSSSLIGFLITRIKITPSSLTSNYKSLAYENSTGNIIDQDRATHIGIWDIEKNYAINNKVVINITNSNPAIETYTVNIYYIDNFRP